MKKNESNILIYGLVVGGILGAGLFAYLTSIFINKLSGNNRERKNKFYEGIDDIFEDSAKFTPEDDSRIDKETEVGIIDELFSRTN